MLNITIGWEWALGIIGILLLLAWKGNGRFTALETSLTWVQEILRELKITTDNLTAKVFASQSPVNLNPVGEQWLRDSGLKNYIDSNKPTLMQLCEAKGSSNPYEVQKRVFQLFDTMSFDTVLDDKLKKFAFGKGTTMAIIRRIGGIYLRNLCLEELGMSKEEIDAHDPEKAKK